MTNTTTSDQTARTDARWQAVSGPHGVASLRQTHWLEEEFLRYEHAPGEWAARLGVVRGRDVTGDAWADVLLNPGEELRVGDLLLKVIERDGALALRVFDPEAPSRAELRGIITFPASDEWVLPGVFTPAESGETRVVRSVDGYEKEEPAVGTVTVELPGETAVLTVSRGAKGLSAVVTDGTSNVDAYRFRFLPIELPASDGSVTVDFNRAFLPPCAFSDQYVCPLPPAGNRLAVRIEAGERLAERAETQTD